MNKLVEIRNQEMMCRERAVLESERRGSRSSWRVFPEHRICNPKMPRRAAGLYRNYVLNRVCADANDQAHRRATLHDALLEF
jgi:hypothetical protein